MKQRTINKCIEIAYALADKSDLRCRHFAFVIDRDKVISIGQNKASRHPLQDLWGYNSLVMGEHAEFNAIRKLNKIDCRKLDFLTFRIDRNNQINIGKPCRTCARMIRRFGFRRLYYSDENGKIIQKVHA